MEKRIYSQQSAAKGTRLTQLDLEFVDFGLKLLQQQKRVNKEGLEKVIQAEQSVFVQPGQGEAVWVEVALATASLAWEAYKAYKSGAELPGDMSMMSRILNADVKSTLSLNQLVEARNELADA